MRANIAKPQSKTSKTGVREQSIRPAGSASSEASEISSEIAGQTRIAQPPLGGRPPSVAVFVETLLPVSDPWARQEGAVSRHHSSAFDQAVVSGNIQLVRAIITQHPKKIPASSLIWPASSGNAEMIDLLLPLAAHEDCTLPLMSAARYGNTDIVRKLIPFSTTRLRGADGNPPNVSERLNESVNIEGREVLARLDLLPPQSLLSASGLTDTTQFLVSPIWVAAAAGHAQTVQDLIPVSDLQDLEGGILLFSAAKAGHLSVVALLAPICKDLESLLASQGEQFTPECYALIRSHLDEAGLNESMPSQGRLPPLKSRLG